MRQPDWYWKKLILPIYRQLYKEAEPSADFDALMESGETKRENWFQAYYLPLKRTEQIMEEHMAKFRLSKREKSGIRFEIYLGSSPYGVRR